MNTIRKSCLGLLLLVTAAVWPASSAHALMIELGLSDTTVEVGETFTMNVIANDVFAWLDPFEEVLTFGFDVFISDTTLVSFEGATVALPFDDDSASFGDTDVAGSVFSIFPPGSVPGGIPNDGTNDVILLATLSFEALAAGALSLGILSDTTDFNEGLIYFLSDKRDITASTDILVTSVPEPSTLMLLGIGLVGLGLMRRQRTNI